MKSHSGIHVRIGESPVFSKSSKQHFTASSSTDAEVNAVFDALPIIERIRYYLNDIGAVRAKIKLHEDNRAAMCIFASPQPLNAKSHVQLRFYVVVVQERLEQYKVDVMHVSTKHMLADTLTKVTGGRPFTAHRKVLLNGGRLVDMVHVSSEKNINVPRCVKLATERRMCLGCSRFMTVNGALALLLDIFIFEALCLLFEVNLTHSAVSTVCCSAAHTGI